MIREVPVLIGLARYRIFVRKFIIMKKTITTALFGFAFLFGAHAQKSAINITDGKAIKGYDAVAFFTESRPVMGRDSLKLDWNGAEWYFADRKDLEQFKQSPEKYAPQYGGYCAYGTSQGHKAPIEVDTWTVLDGKLYFNYNKKVKELWSKDRPGLIKKADENWPLLKDKE
jgi:YHS domain-containing protein